MQQIALARTGRTTTRLGFGCSSVLGALDRKESLAMLEAAVDAGITHFDVAPSYGYGQAEGCLGEVLARHKGKLTVTTKYGIASPKAQTAISIARGLIKPLLRSIPGLKQRLAGVAGKVLPAGMEPTFSPDQARISIEHSLRELKTDRIDILLLHEATAAALTDESLLRLLEDSVSSGRIGDFGVGSEAAKIPELAARRPAFCRVLQYEWSVLDETISHDAAFRLHHRSLTQNFRVLHAALVNRPDVCRRWSDATNQDLARAEILAHLMLKGALTANPQSVILFSSKSKAHVEANITVAEDASLEEPSQRLHELVRAEHDTIFADEQRRDAPGAA